MRRPQYSISGLLIAMLATACFFGGIHFEQRRKQHDAAAARDPGPHGVQTIYVHVANATRLPSDRGKQLADAIRSRIETTSPYKTVSTPSEADSELVCSVSAGGPTQNGREQSLTVKWVDRQGVDIQPPQSLRLHPTELSDDRMIIDRAAAQVMKMMETPW